MREQAVGPEANSSTSTGRYESDALDATSGSGVSPTIIVLELTVEPTIGALFTPDANLASDVEFWTRLMPLAPLWNLSGIDRTLMPQCPMHPADDE